MRKAKLIVLVALAWLIQAQDLSAQIYMDHTDKFTGARGVATKPEKLVGELVMATGNIKIDSTGTNYYIGIIQQNFTDFSATGNTGIDTTKGLTILLESGKKITGQWVTTAVMEPTTFMSRTATSSYSFNRNDFIELSNQKATDFRMIGSRYHLLQMELKNKKQQEVFMRIVTPLLNVK